MPAHFDLARIRLNWERALSPDDRAPASPSPPPPGPDPLTVARQDLAHLDALIATEFGAQHAMLAPFLLRIGQALDAIDDALATGAPLDPLRATLDACLADLEDLLEIALVLPPAR